MNYSTSRKQEENPLLLLKVRKTANQIGSSWVQIVDQNNERRYQVFFLVKILCPNFNQVDLMQVTDVTGHVNSDILINGAKKCRQSDT